MHAYPLGLPNHLLNVASLYYLPFVIYVRLVSKMNEIFFRDDNHMFDRYHQCAPTDYDEWAKSDQAGASQWSYENLRP